MTTPPLVGPQTVTPPLPILPTREHRRDSWQVNPYTNRGLVKAALRGISLDPFRGDDGTLDDFWSEVDTLHIPDVSQTVAKAMRSPMDWCRTIEFHDGNGSDILSLNYKNIYDVNLCYMRVLPSLPFYAFQRMRNTDGYEFQRLGANNSPPIGVEPISTAVMIVPPPPLVAVYSSSLIWTGIEDADLFVNTRGSYLQIPPRVLIAGVSLPVANFSFLCGTQNIEIHYRFGFPPTTYTDGSALAFDGSTGIVVTPKAGTGVNGIPAEGIDWSSGMPQGFTMNVARLVALKLKRMVWEASSQGLGSISVDGASESYGGGPFGGDLDRQEASIMSNLTGQYGLSMAV